MHFVSHGFSYYWNWLHKTNKVAFRERQWYKVEARYGLFLLSFKERMTRKFDLVIYMTWRKVTDLTQMYGFTRPGFNHGSNSAWI